MGKAGLKDIESKERFGVDNSKSEKISEKEYHQRRSNRMAPCSSSKFNTKAFTSWRGWIRLSVDQIIRYDNVAEMQRPLSMRCKITRIFGGWWGSYSSMPVIGRGKRKEERGFALSICFRVD